MKNYLICILLFWAAGVSAQRIQFTASLSAQQVAVGEQFELTFSTNGDIESFEPPSMSGFQVVGGPNQSSSFSSVNGVTTSSISLSYVLLAVKEGSYSIGSAVMRSGGRQYRSNALRIKVVKGSGSGSRSGVQPSPGADPGSVSTGAASDIHQRLFIRAIPSKSTVYQGEQLSVTYKLYTNIDIVDIGLDKMPDFNGFWSQEVKNQTQNVQGAQEMYQGTRYNVAVLKEIILFPERSGRLPLDPLIMTFTVRQSVPSNDPIEQFFGGSYKDVKYKIRSAGVPITVKPLPEAGKPEGFNGAVGTFAISASVDKQVLKANEALNYSLKVNGSGNLKLIAAPEINIPAGIEKYDAKVTDNLNETLNGVSGSREFSYLMIPRQEGSYVLQPLKFSYFNPSTQKYVTLSTSSFSLKVTKGDPGSNVTAFSSPGQEEVKILDKDIRYIKTDVILDKVGANFYGSPAFWVLLLCGPSGFLAAFLYRKKHRELYKDPNLIKSRKAGKMAAKHLANAQKELESGNKSLFYEAVYKGLYGYIGDKFNIAAADLNQEHIVSTLRRAGVQDTLVDRLTDLIGRCELARYAPVSDLSQPQILEKAKEIINEIEHA